MRPLKVLLTFIIIIGALFAVLFLSIKFVGGDLSAIFGSSNNDDRANKANNSQVQGITLNNLNQMNLDGEITLFLNTASRQIVNYRLATGRQNILAKLTGSENGKYVYKSIVVTDNYIYLAWKVDQSSQLVRFDTKDVRKKADVLYTDKSSATIMGIKVFSTNEIYFSEYSLDANDGISYQIVRLANNKTDIVLKESGTNIKVVVGKDASSDKGKVIVQEYDDISDDVNGNCYYVSNLAEVGCEKISDLEYLVTTMQPSDLGYRMGEKGFVKLTDKTGKISTILEGNTDEQFESAYYKGGYVYFISGSVLASSSSQDLSSDNENADTDTDTDAASTSNGTDNTSSSVTSYGTFQPIAIERVKIDGSGREKLVVLPTSVFAEIDFVGNDYSLISLTQMGSDKLSIQPTNLWLLNLKTKALNQLTTIDCSNDDVCEAVFLGAK